MRRFNIIILLFLSALFFSCSEKGSLKNDTKLVLDKSIQEAIDGQEDCDEKAKKAQEIKVDESGELDLAPSEDEGCSLDEGKEATKSPF